MPKEIIQDTAGSYDVRVDWSPEFVQVGIETVAGHSLVTTLYGDPEALERIALEVYGACQQSKPSQGGGGLHGGEQALHLGRRILDIVESSQSNPGEALSYTGVFSTLNRDALNRLIKALRRARDAAYGRDE